MSSSVDSDPFDTLSLAETDASSDFELIDVDHDDVRSFPPSSMGSDAASIASDVDTQPPSPELHASRFHFPDPVSSFEGEGDGPDLEASSLYTLLTPSLNSEQKGVSDNAQQDTAHHDTNDEPQPVISPAINHNDIEKMEVLLPTAEKHADQSQPRRRIIAMAPKAARLVAVLSAVLFLGFNSGSLLGQSQQASFSLVGHALDWNAKFASPSRMPSIGTIDARLASSLASFAVSQEPAPSSSPSSLTIANPDQSLMLAREKANARTNEQIGYPPGRRPGALRKTTTNPVGLSVVNPSPLQSSRVKRFNPPSRRPIKLGKRERLAKLTDQAVFRLTSDLPLLPTLSKSSCLDNATTMSWDYWLAELDNYYQLVARPAILAAKQQAYDAARLAQRYHQEQILPAFASLCEQAVGTAHRTARFASKYREGQVRPACGFVCKHAAQTAQYTARYHEEVALPALGQLRLQAREAAKTTSEELSAAARRTTEYHSKVVKPAIAQYRLKAVEGAKTTSEGLNKAVQKFSLDAAETVQQVKHATNIDLEALGVDAYVGFMMTTLQSMKHNLRSAEKAVSVM